MPVLDCWTVDFYDFTVAMPSPAVDELSGFGDLRIRASDNGARHGTPVLLGPGGIPDPRINLFFRTGDMADARPGTWRRYAYSLVVWLDFLRVFGRGWSEATPRDVEAFKEWRLTDLRNDERIQSTSFDTDRAALNTFYRWAGVRYGIANPVASAGVRSGRRPSSAGDVPGHGGGRDPLRPAGSSRRQVKWMLRAAYEQWRNIGLCGYAFDGERRPGWRGANEDRDAAFTDGLYGTGLRLQEWASVLDVELPPVGTARFTSAWLAAACVKRGGEGRFYRIPRSVLSAVAGYADPLEGSRMEAIRRAQRAGRYDRLYGVRIVTGYNPRTRRVTIEGDAGAVPVSVDVLAPDERRLLFRRTPQGLEPLWLWLAPSGLPKKPHGWEDTFQAANARIAEVWIGTAGQHLTVEERERRKAECPLWARPHMLRHSFCLKWFSILSAVWQRRIAGFTEDEVRDLREQLGDIWYQLSTLMGHKHPETTRDIYLEPFTSLEIDYLMALLDEEETAGVDALLRAVTHEGGRTVTGVVTPGARDGLDRAEESE
ncbi:site-specific integrase [Streptomyces celluloflavus]|uniref:Site-specific integrase n=1 Tax=Streptomyces celluloflavus TaxID=58344 RepID=A0ABW7R686_9ACTN|nr:site-specific integrase [Streptomyces celluloflavus]